MFTSVNEFLYFARFNLARNAKNPVVCKRRSRTSRLFSVDLVIKAKCEHVGRGCSFKSLLQ